MNNQNIQKFGPAGDSLFGSCYRCDHRYDFVALDWTCPACEGCGECGCCPCGKPTCEFCVDEEAFVAAEAAHSIDIEGVSPYAHYDPDSAS